MTSSGSSGSRRSAAATGSVGEIIRRRSSVDWSNYGAGVWWSSVGDGSLLLLREGSPPRRV